MAARVKSVRRESLKDQIVAQLTERIASGELKPGDRLASTRDLADQFEVGQATVREALSVLAAQRFIDVRHGSGSFVNHPEQWNALEPAVMLARDKIAALLELIEARELLEPLVAALAAERASPADISHMEQNAKLTGTAEENARTDIAFHLSVARASHNQVLLIMLHSVNELMHELRRESFAIGKHIIDQVNFGHCSILEKIQQGDPQGAQEAMQRHIDEARENYWAVLEAQRRSQ